MLTQQLDQVAYALPDALRQPFDELVATLRPQVSPLLPTGYYDDQQPIDILRSCGTLLPWAQRVARHCQVEPERLARHSEADVLVAGRVDWHHDQDACYHAKRMLIAYPGIDGFVLHVAQAHCHSGRSERAINRAVAIDPSRIIRKSVPLVPGMVCFIDHAIYHSVSFEGERAALDGAPASLFLDFGVDTSDDA